MWEVSLNVYTYTDKFDFFESIKYISQCEFIEYYAIQ